MLILGAPILLRKLFRGNKSFKKIGLLLLLIIGAVYLVTQYPFDSLPQQNPDVVDGKESGTVLSRQSDIRSLYDSRRSGEMVETQGYVTRILKDDNDGSRHQKFIIEIPDGLTLMVAHNIDLAPRVPLKENDQVLVYGQYEWSNRGGVLHWTHHDPNKSHEEGWIEHQGKRYE